MSGIGEIDRKTSVNRFVTSLAGAFRAFHLYRQNNKALDEVMDNLVSRSRDATAELLKLGITSRSLIYEGEIIGSLDLARHLSLALRTLGFREILFRPPLHGRHFFQFLNILSNQDPLEVKQEKLLSLTGDEDDKPISLIPLVANSLLLHLSDEALTAKLEPLRLTTADGGPDFKEDLEAAPPTCFSDLATRLSVRAESLDKNLRVFVRNLLDAVREGHFSWERFLKVFPLPISLKESLFEKMAEPPLRRTRRPTTLGLAFHPSTPRPKEHPSTDWKTQLVVYSNDEIKQRNDLKIFGSQQQGLAELELAQAMLSENGSNYLLGLRILIRVLVYQNPTSAQERAIKIGLSVWLRRDQVGDDMGLLSLLSSLRQALALPHNVALTLFPIRSLTIEAEMFVKLTEYLVSLGDVAMPSLIQALNVEEDRSMRRKLCIMLTAMAREQGTRTLVEAIEAASPFLLRNIVMILGDVRSQEALENLTDLTRHPQRIVRLEAIRSLGKIGTPEATKPLLAILDGTNQEEKTVALEQLANRRDRALLEPLIRMARQETQWSEWKKTLLTSIATLGGLASRQFLESQQKGTSLLSGLTGVNKDEQALITTLLRKLT